MSAYELTNFEINLLVHLALHGPAGAERWMPLTDEPEELGARLCRRNSARVGPGEDGPRPAYEFAPLELEISAVEGLKQVSHYIYQTGDQEGRWRRGGVGELMDNLQGSLIVNLPGWQEAPWSWTADDRMAHEPKSPHPSVDGEPETDPRVDEVLRRFEQAGAALLGTSVHTEVLGIGDPRSILGTWKYPEKYIGMPLLQVALLSHEGAAQWHYLQRRSVEPTTNPYVHVGLFRFGNMVVHLRYDSGPPNPDVSELELWQLVERLGEPDERWTNLDPPVFQGSGAVFAQQVVLPPGTEGSDRCVVGRTPKSLANLAAMIEDDDLRARVLAVNTRKHTVLLFSGVPFVAGVESTSVRDIVEIGTYNPRKIQQVIEVRVHGSTRGVGSVILVDRPPTMPTRAALIDPEQHRYRVLADVAQPATVDDAAS